MRPVSTALAFVHRERDQNGAVILLRGVASDHEQLGVTQKLAPDKILL